MRRQRTERAHGEMGQCASGRGERAKSSAVIIINGGLIKDNENGNWSKGTAAALPTAS